MYKNLLSKKFFRDNPIEQLTAQQLVYSQIDMPEIAEIATSITRNMIDRAGEQREKLEKEEDAEALLKLLRGGCDNINYDILRKKVIDKEEELIPKIIDMLINSGNDVFIEHASIIIAKCKTNYSKELVNILDKIRKPYTLSLVSITLGFIGDEEIIPTIYNKYIEFKKNYHDEFYEQGPLLALCKLNDRFYSSH